MVDGTKRNDAEFSRRIATIFGMLTDYILVVKNCVVPWRTVT